MTVTTTGLTRAAGVCTAVAGAIFVAVQVNHPAMTVESVETADWVLRNSAKALMAALALVGIAGMYLSQVRRMGVLGLVGATLFSIGYLVMFGVEVVAAAVLPLLTSTQPALVGDVVLAAFGGTPVGDIGGIQTLLSAMGLGFILGGLVFGIALFRAGVLWRWASALLAVSTVGAAALAFLPDSFNRPMAVPAGIALVGLGISLVRTTRSTDAVVASDDLDRVSA
jgi:hypothetical protein